MTERILETKSIDQPPEKPHKENFKDFPENTKDLAKEQLEKEAAEFKQNKDLTKGELKENEKPVDEGTGVKTKFENEKNVKAEGKDEFKEQQEADAKAAKGELKETKTDFKEDKDAKPEHESKPPEKPNEVIDPFTTGVDRAALLDHAQALEDAARALRHFIEQAERPDPRRGALRNEPDQADE